MVRRNGVTLPRRRVSVQVLRTTRQRMRTFAGAGRPRSNLYCGTVSTSSPTGWTRNTSPKGTITGIISKRKRKLGVTTTVFRGTTTSRRRRRRQRREATVTRSTNHTVTPISIKRAATKNATTGTAIPKSLAVENSIGTNSPPWNRKDTTRSWTLTPRYSSSTITRSLI